MNLNKMIYKLSAALNPTVAGQILSSLFYIRIWAMQSYLASFISSVNLNITDSM
jgi:hypothetical protein